MQQGGHGQQEMKPDEVSGDEAGLAGVVSQTQTAMAGGEGPTCTDGQSATAVGETLSLQVRYRSSLQSKIDKAQEFLICLK